MSSMKQVGLVAFVVLALGVSPMAEAQSRADSEAAGAQRTGTALSHRSIAELHDVFVRNKDLIVLPYRAALVSNPSLKGRVVLELKIAPEGTVTAKIISKEFSVPEFERELLASVERMKFDAKNAEEMVVQWPLDLMPR